MAGDNRVHPKRVKVDLKNFYNDHRAKAYVTFNKFAKVIDLQKHIKRIFVIPGEIYLTTEDQSLLPPMETICIICPKDIIRVHPVNPFPQLATAHINSGITTPIVDEVPPPPETNSAAIDEIEPRKNQTAEVSPSLKSILIVKAEQKPQFIFKKCIKHVRFAEKVIVHTAYSEYSNNTSTLQEDTNSETIAPIEMEIAYSIDLCGSNNDTSTSERQITVEKASGQSSVELLRQNLHNMELPSAVGVIKAGDAIAFKMYKMGEHCVPELSEFMIGIIQNMNSEEEVIINVLAGFEETKEPDGRFSVKEDKEEAEDDSVGGVGMLTMRLADILDPKFVNLNV